MKPILCLLCLFVMLCLTACGNGDDQPSQPQGGADTGKTSDAGAKVSDAKTPGPPQVVWELDQDLSGPESAYVDVTTGTIFVSNVAGSPAEKDGQGWITKLDLEGNVITAKWVDGLNAPKGMRAAAGILWVSDINELIGITIATGEIAHRVTIDEAKFLNDVAAAPDGTVYISDSAGVRIYQYKDGNVALFTDDAELGRPNGLLVEGDRLIVGAAGQLLAYDRQTKERTQLAAADATGATNLDGIEADGRGGYIVSDWPGGKVMHVNSKGDVRTILQLGRGTADLAYLPDKHLLILPRMVDNKVTAYDLSKTVE